MCNLDEPRFQNDDAAREYLESLRWPNGPVCPHCGGNERIYAVAARKERKIRAGLYKCGDCDGQFTVTVGTVFESSKVPLRKWAAATHLLCSSKKGMSSKQLERMLGVTYKTAWFMSHRIREAMRDGNPGLLGGGGTVVEVDQSSTLSATSVNSTSATTIASALASMTWPAPMRPCAALRASG